MSDPSDVAGALITEDVSQIITEGGSVLVWGLFPVAPRLWHPPGFFFPPWGFCPTGFLTLPIWDEPLSKLTDWTAASPVSTTWSRATPVQGVWRS